MIDTIYHSHSADEETEVQKSEVSRGSEPLLLTQNFSTLVSFAFEARVFFFFFFLFRTRLGVKWELQLPAYTTAIAMPDLSRFCDLHCTSQQCQILNPLSKPGIEITSSWTLSGS